MIQPPPTTISTGVNTYFNQQKRRRNGGPSDEMFI
jgi:hypothetical protein